MVILGGQARRSFIRVDLQARCAKTTCRRALRSGPVQPTTCATGSPFLPAIEERTVPQTAFATYAQHSADAHKPQGKGQKKKDTRLRDNALNHRNVKGNEEANAYGQHQ